MHSLIDSDVSRVQRCYEEMVSAITSTSAPMSKTEEVIHNGIFSKNELLSAAAILKLACTAKSINFPKTRGWSNDEVLNFYVDQILALKR